MTITKDDVIDLMNRFHQVVMIDKGGAASQAAFFLHPEPWIIVPHGADISMQTNYEIHQRLVDEKHAPFADWEITRLSRDPERVRVAAPFLEAWYLPVLTAGGLVWSAAFALFAVVYGRLLIAPAR